MRFKKKFDTLNNGYTNSLIDSTPIPVPVNNKVREQIKEIQKKENEYIKSMSGECVSYKVNA